MAISYECPSGLELFAGVSLDKQELHCSRRSSCCRNVQAEAEAYVTACAYGGNVAGTGPNSDD
eukprot:scaffold547_cov384-Prasinococcus_capsulatus_cf.AAC.45